MGGERKSLWLRLDSSQVAKEPTIRAELGSGSGSGAVKTQGVTGPPSLDNLGLV